MRLRTCSVVLGELALTRKASPVTRQNAPCKSVWLNSLWQGLAIQQAGAKPVYNVQLREFGS